MTTKVIDTRIFEIRRSFKNTGKTIEEKLIELFERKEEKEVVDYDDAGETED